MVKWKDFTDLLLSWPFIALAGIIILVFYLLSRSVARGVALAQKKNEPAPPKQKEVPRPAGYQGAKSLNYAAPVDATKQEKGKCENCGRDIGKLEMPRLWQNHVVCAECASRLAAGK